MINCGVTFVVWRVSLSFLFGKYKEKFSSIWVSRLSLEPSVDLSHEAKGDTLERLPEHMEVALLSVTEGSGG